MSYADMIEKSNKENKFPIGSTVYALEFPGVKLTVRRYVSRVYYCLVTGNPSQREQVYFERELSSEHPGK